jgi:NADH dehydrogenase
VVFGRGDNPIQFSTVSEVATAVERALADPREARAVTEVGGPSRTMNQLATTVGSELDRIVGPARHVPRVVLRTLASAPSTQPGRQAQAALVMDTCDLATGRPARRRH